MSVLILSIHIKHHHSGYWRRLQPQFVAETDDVYEYGVVVNGDDPTLYANNVLHIPQKVSHKAGIAAVLDIFRAHRHRFTHFLLLDSDCWPVRPDWQEILNNLMGDQYLFAAPMRVENFDTFPHPCAFYMKAEFLDKANFGFERVTNLLGMDISDVGTAMPQGLNEKQIWYPLLKTNRLSPHPLYASIYGDLFYHHCAGSRGLGFRANSFKFYDHIFTRRAHRIIYNQTTAKLVQNPKQFIDELRGDKFRQI